MWHTALKRERILDHLLVSRELLAATFKPPAEQDGACFSPLQERFMLLQQLFQVRLSLPDCARAVAGSYSALWIRISVF